MRRVGEVVVNNIFFLMIRGPPGTKKGRWSAASGGLKGPEGFLAAQVDRR